MTIQIQELSHDLIDRDPNNPRQVFDETRLQELANDLAVRGMLQPITVRPHPAKKGRYMLVFGERRWRAAALVDMKRVPAMVRDMNDLDVLEAQIAENDKRSDVHPLEEADAYRRLHEEHGRDVDEIAELCGKSRAYIYAAMKLCALTAEPRRAFLSGKLDKSRALLVARLPASQQATACEEIADRDDDVMSYRDAAHHIRRNYMLRLADAPFRVGDGLLVEKAGPCTTCEKRTGNQQELFADVCSEKGGADLCTDGKCYQEKVDAHWQRVKNEAEARGRQVLEGKAAEHAGSYGDKKMLDLDSSAHGVDSSKSWRQVLGKHAEPTAVARDPRGNEIKELISRADLPQLMKEAGVKAPKNGNGSATTTAYDKAQREARERSQLEAAVTRRLRDEVEEKAGSAPELAFWRLLARMALRVMRSDAKRDLLKHYKLEKPKSETGSLSYGQAETLIKFIDTLKDVLELRSFVLEALMAESRSWTEYEFSDDDNDGFQSDDERQASLSNLRDAAELLGIDVDAIVKSVKADLVEAEKEKAEKKNGKANPDVDVPGVTALIGLDTEQMRALYKRVFGVETKREREWMRVRLEKRHREQHPLDDAAKAQLAKQAELDAGSKKKAPATAEAAS